MNEAVRMPHADVSPSDCANALRALAMDAVEKAKSGHPGMPMGMADVASVLFRQFLKIDPSEPGWPDRDRFVLSAGHGSMLQYALHFLMGYPDMPMSELQRFRQLGAHTAGHPEYGHALGVETTTGPLGQGLATAVGMAIAERMMNARFGSALVDHRTWVIAGDGCLMEGVSQEAIDLAGHLRLGKLVVLWDDNEITIDGATKLSTSTAQLARFRASGWATQRVYGHDHEAIARALETARKSSKPTLIACRTIIGKGAPNKQGGHSVHGAPLGDAEIAAARAELGWTLPPFELPSDVVADWREAGARGKADAQSWSGRLAASGKAGEFNRWMAGELPDMSGVEATFNGWLEGNQKAATRKASELALEVLTAAVPEMVGGSADLTGSNLTKTKATPPLTADDYSGRYVYYGIREFGMAAAMNGMALHGGVLPYGGTFLVFSDYCRNAIRMSALQKAKVVYVLTHDSIGLGEDGPTHQPIEHIMSMRMIPNLEVFRPADVIETAECWQLAVANQGTPSVLALSRQNLPQLRHSGPNLSAKGAYRLEAAVAPRKVVLVATGSEVEIALAVRAALETKGIGADVVSMPSMSRFLAQDAAYKADVLPKGVLVASIEAGTTFGWERITGLDGLRFGIDTFGASAPINDLYDMFGLTAEKITPQIVAALQN